MKTVVYDESVEIFSGDDKGSRDKHSDIFPFVVQIVFLQNMIQECKSARFAAHGAVAESGKPDGIVVCLRVKLGHHTETLADSEVMNHSQIHIPDHIQVSIGIDSDRTEQIRYGEKASSVEPSGDIVLVSEILQSFIADASYNLLELIQIPCSGNDVSGLGIGDDKVPESKFPAYVFAHLMGKRLGGLLHESHSQLIRHRPHAFLRRLHQKRHRRVVFFDETAQIHTGVNLFRS